MGCTHQRQSSDYAKYHYSHRAEPFVPPIKGVDSVPYLTSDTIWALRELSQQVGGIGRCPIGTELTQTFARLGSQVTQVEQLPRIMTREDPEISAMVAASLRADGVRILADHRAQEILDDDGERVLRCVSGGGEEILVPFDELLVAVGRKANVTVLV